MNKRNLYLVRHGQSIYNLENRFTGWKDVDLTELGKKQAKEAGQILSDVHFDYCSILFCGFQLWKIKCTYFSNC